MAMLALSQLLASVFVCAAVHKGAEREPIFAVGTSDAYRAANVKVAALENHLQEMQLARKQDLETHRAKYEARLQAKRMANVKLAVQNTEIAKVAREGQSRIFELQKTVQELSHDVKVWQIDWNDLRLNISMAIQLSTATQKLYNLSEAPETQILRELDGEDARQEAVEEHVGRLKELMQPTIATHAAFMQTAPARKRPSIVQALDAGMAALAAEQEQKESKLISHFFQLFQLENQRHENLLLEQTRLNATCKSMSELHGRLVLAVEHLHGLSRQLANRGFALRAFVGRVGSRPMPRDENLAHSVHAMSDADAAPVRSDDSSSLSEHEFEALMVEPVLPNQALKLARLEQDRHFVDHAVPKGTFASDEDALQQVPRQGTAIAGSSQPSAETRKGPNWLKWWSR